MANRDFKDVQALEREVKILGGRITFTGDATTKTPTIAEGTGYTVATSATDDDGIFTMTLGTTGATDKYSDLLYCHAYVAGITERYVELSAHSVGTGSLSFIVKDKDDDNPTSDLHFNGLEVQFIAFLKNSSVT
jgi:hypothetical protein|tara:strand:- start:37 stop:438 length:402 start_codon:yes stop_codon:yes gene_type:complete